MKWKKRIIIWIAVSLSLQCLVLFYIEHYFLAAGSKVATKRIVEEKIEKIKNIDIRVPENAEKILASYDAKYVCYYENEKLKIADCKDASIKNIEAEEGSKISIYKWLPDRNRMYLVEKESNDESSKLVLYYYDVEKGEKAKIKDLEWADAKAEVEDIQLSTLTGGIYVKVSSQGARSSIYRMARMVRDKEEKVTKIDTIPKIISNISLMRHEDNLVYEGSVYNKIYSTSSDESISVEGVDKLTLIGDDDDDNVYLGELKDNLISKIHYGKTLENTSDWKVIELQKPCANKDLFVSCAGKVYQNDEMKGQVREISTGTQTSYEGELLQLYTEGVVSLVGNKISFVLFKQVNKF